MRKAGKVPLGMQAAETADLQRLAEFGPNPEHLLAQRLVVMGRRKVEATGVTATHLGREVQLDGYALPLKWEDERAVEFLLVLWVVACIHTPPPPNEVL